MGLSQFIARMQCAGNRSNLRVMLGLGLIRGEIRVAVWIKQAQAREMAFGPKLFGRGSEQQQALGLLADGLDEFIFVADFGFAPFEVMSLIDNQQIPAGVLGLFGAFGVGGEEIDAAEDELIIEERVLIRQAFLDGGAAFFIKDVRPKVELAQQLDEPLMHERLGHENQQARGAAGDEQAMQYESGLNGLAEAHFIGQQHARSQPVADFLCDVQLMRDEINAATNKAAHG